MAKGKIKKTPGTIIFIAVFCTVLVLYAISMIVPLLWGLNTSLKSNADFKTFGNVLGFPNINGYESNGRLVGGSHDELLKLKNYTEVINQLYLEAKVNYVTSYGVRVRVDTFKVDTLGLIVNTLIFCGIACINKAFVPAISAYMCSKYRYASSAIIYYTLLVIMTVPIVGTQPAELNMLRDMQIYSTWFQHVLQTFNMSGIYFFVFYAYYQGLSDTYMEAAEIDGASQLRILLTIVIPLSITTITAVILLTFVGYWNNYSTPLLYYPDKPTLALGVQKAATGGSGTGINTTPEKIAACMMLAVPLLILFLCFHKKLMGNLSIGGIKE